MPIGDARWARYTRCPVGRAAARRGLRAPSEMFAIASQGASRKTSVAASLAPRLLFTLWSCQPHQWKYCDMIIIPAMMAVVTRTTVLLYDGHHTCLPVNKRLHLLMGKWGRGTKEEKRHQSPSSCVRETCSRHLRKLTISSYPGIHL